MIAAKTLSYFCSCRQDYASCNENAHAPLLNLKGNDCNRVVCARCSKEVTSEPGSSSFSAKVLNSFKKGFQAKLYLLQHFLKILVAAAEHTQSNKILDKQLHPFSLVALTCEKEGDREKELDNAQIAIDKLSITSLSLLLRNVADMGFELEDDKNCQVLEGLLLMFPACLFPIDCVKRKENEFNHIPHFPTIPPEESDSVCNCSYTSHELHNETMCRIAYYPELLRETIHCVTSMMSFHFRDSNGVKLLGYEYIPRVILEFLECPQGPGMLSQSKGHLAISLLVNGFGQWIERRYSSTVSDLAAAYSERNCYAR